MVKENKLFEVFGSTDDGLFMNFDGPTVMGGPKQDHFDMDFDLLERQMKKERRNKIIDELLNGEE
jgi:hypothetical protein